jgi:uncharacterized membrane protein YkoI
MRLFNFRYGGTQRSAEDDEVESPAIRHAPLSIVEAIEVVQARFGGVVTEAELEEERGQPVWGVEIVTDAGLFKRVTVDSATGRLAERPV